MIYCIGDSHTSVFSGHVDIIECHPARHTPMWPEFQAIRIGAPTAYNLYEKYGEYIRRILTTDYPPAPDDWVMLVAGEIDIRCHIIKQHLHKKIPIAIVVKDVVDRYSRALMMIKEMGFKTAAWNAVVPSTYTYTETPEDMFSHIGTFDQRNEAALLFNRYVQEFCEHNDMQFVSIYEELLKSYGEHNGVCRCSQLYRDEIHLHPNIRPFLLQATEKMRGSK